jgi:hypothetical protein
MTITNYPNPISLGDVRNEFGGGNPVSISQYYSGGPFVKGGTPGFPGGSQLVIPGGGKISLDNFHGASNVVSGSGATAYQNSLQIATMPAAATWLKVNMVGGGGGGAGGDNGGHDGGPGAGGGYIQLLVLLPLTSGPKYLYSYCGAGGGGGTGGKYGETNGAAPGIGGGGAAFSNTNIVYSKGGDGGLKGLNGISGSGGGGGGSTCIWYQTDAGLIVPIVAVGGGGGGGGGGLHGGGDTRANQSNASPNNGANFVGINSGINVSGNKGYGGDNAPTYYGSGSYDGAGGGGGGSLGGPAGLPGLYSYQPGTPSSVAYDGSYVPPQPGYYYYDLNDYNATGGSAGLAEYNNSYYLSPGSYSTLTYYAAYTPQTQSTVTSSYGFAGGGTGEYGVGGAGAGGVVSFAFTNGDPNSVNPPTL